MVRDDAAQEAASGFEGIVSASRARLARAEHLARLQGDPAADGYGALLAHLDALAAWHGAERERLEDRVLKDLGKRAGALVAAAAAGHLRAAAALAWARVAGLIAAAALAGLAAGVWIGEGWGEAVTARAVAGADRAVAAVAVSEGPAAAEAWRRLMRLNPVLAMLRGCRGAAVARDGDATGCHLWLRIGTTAQ